MGVRKEITWEEIQKEAGRHKDVTIKEWSSDSRKIESGLYTLIVNKEDENYYTFGFYYDLYEISKDEYNWDEALRGHGEVDEYNAKVMLLYMAQDKPGAWEQDPNFQSM